MEKLAGTPWVWLSIFLVVAGNVAYHLGQRSVPRGAHPLAAILVMYCVAAAITLLLWPFFARGASLGPEILATGRFGALVGIAIVAIELGFLLAYRAGWPISTASLTASVFVAVSLLAIGAVALHEGLSPTRLLGVLVCLLGLWLVQKG